MPSPGTERSIHGSPLGTRCGFLYLGTPDTPMHVGSLTIFASAAAARDKVFERFREHTAARLDLLPSYRRRLEMSRSASTTQYGSMRTTSTSTIISVT